MSLVFYPTSVFLTYCSMFNPRLRHPIIENLKIYFSTAIECVYILIQTEYMSVNDN